MPQQPPDARFVCYRLEEAGQTLLALPAKGCLPSGVRSAWPDFANAAIDAYGWETAELKPAIPSATAITRMDEAYRWVQLIPADRRSHRRIVLMRSLVSPRTERHIWSWRRIGAACGWSHTAVRGWHGEAVDWIVTGLNRIGLCAASGGSVGPSAVEVRDLLRDVARGRETA